MKVKLPQVSRDGQSTFHRWEGSQRCHESCLTAGYRVGYGEVNDWDVEGRLLGAWATDKARFLIRYSDSQLLQLPGVTLADLAYTPRVPRGNDEWVASPSDAASRGGRFAYVVCKTANRLAGGKEYEAHYGKPSCEAIVATRRGCVWNQAAQETMSPALRQALVADLARRHVALMKIYQKVRPLRPETDPKWTGESPQGIGKSEMEDRLRKGYQELRRHYGSGLAFRRAWAYLRWYNHAFEKYWGNVKAAMQRGDQKGAERWRQEYYRMLRRIERADDIRHDRAKMKYWAQSKPHVNPLDYPKRTMNLCQRSCFIAGGKLGRRHLLEPDLERWIPRRDRRVAGMGPLLALSAHRYRRGELVAVYRTPNGGCGYEVGSPAKLFRHSKPLQRLAAAILEDAEGRQR